MSDINIVHVIGTVDRGGAARAMLSLSMASAGLGNFRHRIVALRPSDSEVVAAARADGLDVMVDPAHLGDELAAADIVAIEYYNHPLVAELLASGLPACRLLVWCHVAGDAPPNVLTEDLIEEADRLVASGEYTYNVPALAGRDVPLVHGPTSRDRATALAALPLRPSHGKNVGYVGTVDFAKMHRNFVTMHAAIPDPDVRVIVCGGSAYGDTATLDVLLDEARAHGRLHTFDFRGRIEEVTEAFGEFDVYGYPLCAGNYACAELNLQEAMFAGLPAVVLSNSAAGTIVKHRRIGYVVNDEREYTAAVTYLLGSPATRRELGAQARRYAAEVYDSARLAASMNAIYRDLLREPKRRHGWHKLARLPVPSRSGAALFLAALGTFAEPYHQTLSSEPDIQEGAEATIVALSAKFPILVSSGFGSPSHYLRFFPDDPYLAYWSALTRRGSGEAGPCLDDLRRALV